jgi:hypothetical protein
LIDAAKREEIDAVTIRTLKLPLAASGAIVALFAR